MSYDTNNTADDRHRPEVNIYDQMMQVTSQKALTWEDFVEMQRQLSNAGANFLSPRDIPQETKLRIVDLFWSNQDGKVFARQEGADTITELDGIFAAAVAIARTSG